MIRFADPSDLPTIARLIRGLAEFERLTDRVVFDEEQLGQHLFGTPRYAEVLLAEEAGQVVGFALFFHTYSTFMGQPGIYLEDLFVDPEQRGKGHGKALLLALARLAVERGCCKLEWSVLTWNTPAIGFYKALGAVVMDEWHMFRLMGSELRNAAAASSPSPASGEGRGGGLTSPQSDKDASRSE
jgi:GNAT superfamily N-acetyltransferase